MDIQMPVMDGYTAVRMIRAWEHARGAARIPIIALTASALEESVHRSLAAGCDAHVAKPVKKATLFEAILNLPPGRPRVRQLTGVRRSGRMGTA
jgi:CheY-like chemotaxis protein